MTYVLGAFVGVGLLLLLGMVYGAVVSDIGRFRFRVACQGGSWRHAFPRASKASIRNFLQVFVDAFAFPASKALTFGPDDSILAIYKQIHPSRWTPDAMELETFAKDLEVLCGVRLASMWSESLTLGEVFSAVQAAAQPGAPADGLGPPLS